MVVLALVTSDDAANAGAQHLEEGVLGRAGVAVVIEGVGEGPAELQAVIELAEGEQPGIA